MSGDTGWIGLTSGGAINMQVAFHYEWANNTLTLSSFQSRKSSGTQTYDGYGGTIPEITVNGSQQDLPAQNMYFRTSGYSWSGGPLSWTVSYSTYVTVQITFRGSRNGNINSAVFTYNFNTPTVGNPSVSISSTSSTTTSINASCTGSAGTNGGSVS